MGDTLRLNMNNDGSLNDPDAVRVQTEKDYIDNPDNGGAQIGHVRFQGEDSTISIQQGSQLQANELDSELDTLAFSFAEGLDLMQAQLTGGRVPPREVFESKMRQLTDLQMRLVALGGDANDATLVSMRERLDWLSDRADMKRR